MVRKQQWKLRTCWRFGLLFQPPWWFLWNFLWSIALLILYCFLTDRMFFVFPPLDRCFRPSPERRCPI